MTGQVQGLQVSTGKNFIKSKFNMLFDVNTMITSFCAAFWLLSLPLAHTTEQRLPNLIAGRYELKINGLLCTACAEPPRWKTRPPGEPSLYNG